MSKSGLNRPRLRHGFIKAHFANIVTAGGSVATMRLSFVKCGVGALHKSVYILAGKAKHASGDRREETAIAINTSRWRVAASRDHSGGQLV